mgnify:CR=1 FL=1
MPPKKESKTKSDKDSKPKKETKTKETKETKETKPKKEKKSKENMGYVCMLYGGVIKKSCVVVVPMAIGSNVNEEFETYQKYFGPHLQAKYVETETPEDVMNSLTELDDFKGEENDTTRIEDSIFINSSSSTVSGKLKEVAGVKAAHTLGNKKKGTKSKDGEEENEEGEEEKPKSDKKKPKSTKSKKKEEEQEPSDAEEEAEEEPEEEEEEEPEEKPKKATKGDKKKDTKTEKKKSVSK